MENGKSIEDSRAELVAVANDMLSGRMCLIEGVRRICSLRYEVRDLDNEAFLPIIATDSETDHFAIGEVRKHYAPRYLAQLDAEMEAYLDEAKGEILSACKEIIRTFS